MWDVLEGPMVAQGDDESARAAYVISRLDTDPH
jgi:hypothetical protein